MIRRRAHSRAQLRARLEENYERVIALEFGSATPKEVAFCSGAGNSAMSALPALSLLETRVLGAVGGASGKSSPFGTGVVGSGGPFQSSLYGNGGNAKRIAYLIDASGSLIDTLPFVIMELKRSISGLSDKQSFCVIFFQGEDAIEARGATQTSGLMPATAANKPSTTITMMISAIV